MKWYDNALFKEVLGHVLANVVDLSLGITFKVTLVINDGRDVVAVDYWYGDATNLEYPDRSEQWWIEEQDFIKAKTDWPGNTNTRNPACIAENLMGLMEGKYHP